MTNYIYRYSAGFLLRKQVRKRVENIFFATSCIAVFLVHCVLTIIALQFSDLFSALLSAPFRYLAGTLRVEVISRSSGRLAHKRTNKHLHSGACSPGISNGGYRRCFPKSEARFPYNNRSLFDSCVFLDGFRGNRSRHFA